jgi:pilus assembly protein CpaF
MPSNRIERHHENSHREWLKRVLTVHAELVRSLEWSCVRVSTQELIEKIPTFVHQLCEHDSERLSDDEEEALVQAVISETVGLGPLDTILSDPLVSDVLVNSSDEVFIERNGRLIRTPLCFADDDHLMRIIQRIAGRVGRRIDESSPMVDARLEDGSRVHAVVRPLALHGPTLSIRRFGTNPIGIDDLISHGSLTREMVDLLSKAVQARVSFLISGGTGAGKTTLLNAVSSFIPKDERIVTIEDAAELKLQHPHVISLETRPSNAEEKGKVTIRDLVRTSLRMRPDRILVGEVRGDEVIDMLQAMNTGHPGSLSTIHANNAKDALSRLEVMVGMSGQELPVPVLRHYVTAGIRMLVHVARLKGGARRVMQISEVTGLKNGEYRLREIFGYREDGVDENGDSVGEFYATGYLPRFMKPKKLVSAKQKLLAAPTSQANVIASPVAAEPQVAPGRPRFTIVSTQVEVIEVDSDDESENETSSLDGNVGSLNATPSSDLDTHGPFSATDTVIPTEVACDVEVPRSNSEALHLHQGIAPPMKTFSADYFSADSFSGPIMVGVSDYQPSTLLEYPRHKVDHAIEALRFGIMDDEIESVAKMQVIQRTRL